MADQISTKFNSYTIGIWKFDTYMAIFSKKESTDQESVKEQGGEKKRMAKSEQVSGNLTPAPLLGTRVSEKSTRLATANKYVFNVVKKTNKVEIKKAIEKAHKVKVLAVNIVNVKGKVRHMGRVSGKTSGFKKAIVTLKAGDKIEGATETI